MRSVRATATAALILLATLAACENGVEPADPTQEGVVDPLAAERAPDAAGKEQPTMDLQQILDEALDDEYLAQATYRAVIAKFGEVRPFVNIVEAEGRHARALLGLYERYGLTPPDDPWAGKIEAPETLLEACEAGVQAEIDNAEMYDRLLAHAEQADVVEVLRNLQRASQERHLPAFRRCVERGGSGGRGPGGGGGHGHRRRHRGGR